MQIKPVGDGIVEYRFSRLFSSNTYLKEHITEFQPWAIIRAEDQYAGRGRLDRSWNMVAGKDLAFSVLIPLSEIPSQSWTNITQAAALAVAISLEALGFAPSIKWPNDILISNAKLCGILCESVVLDSKAFAVAGIGLNVNSTAAELDLKSRMITSLFDESGMEYSLEGLMTSIVQHLKIFSNKLKRGFETILDDYNDRLCIYDSNEDKFQTIVIAGENVNVHILGINHDGGLIIKRRGGNGETEIIVSGEIV